MSKEYIEAFRDILGILSAVSGCEVDMNSERIITVKSALKRLEEIDNSNPSEALECLERIDNTLCLNNIKGKLEFGIDTEEHTDCDSVIGMTEDLEYIKQALLKEQEPKQYLKWEDLEFKEKEQTRMEVLLNGSRYLLEYYAVSEKEFVFIRARATKTIIFNLLGRCSTDKQFFNDLHLERVEE